MTNKKHDTPRASFKSTNSGVSSRTVSARLRAGRSVEESISSQLRFDLDLSAQREKFEFIFELIKKGELFADKNGEVYRIFDDSTYHKLRGRKSKEGYVGVKIKVHEKFLWVARRHIVLLQYAGLPPLLKTDNTMVVWTAEHINSDRSDDSPVNLCWMTITNNSTFKKSKKSTINYEQKLQSLELEGEVIRCSSYFSPHPENVIESLESYRKTKIQETENAWKKCLSEGWQNLTEDWLQRLKSVISSRFEVPDEFLLRVALASRNSPIILSDSLFVTSPRSGKTFCINDIRANDDTNSFSIVYFSDDVRTKLKDVCCKNKALFEKLERYIPHNACIELDEYVTFRTQLTPSLNGRRTKEIRGDWYKFMKKSPFNSALLFTHPELCLRLISDESGNAVNPVLLPHGANDRFVITSCARCSVPCSVSTLKALTRRKRDGSRSTGNYCQACLAKQRAKNGF